MPDTFKQQLPELARVFHDKTLSSLLCVGHFQSFFLPEIGSEDATSQRVE